MDKFLTMTDEKLVKLYAKGNNEAFDVLLNRHKQAVYSYILYVVRNRDMAEDIFQETFIKAIVTIKQGRYTESGKFRAWINRIAHNLIIDAFRQQKSENTVSNEEYEYDLFNNSSLSDDTVENVIIKKQVLNDVKKLIEFLPETQREVLHMRYYKNMSFKEISDVTGVSINTALGRMRYAILNMRKLADENRMILSV